MTYVPQGGVPYTVQNDDDWWKLAAKPEIKALGYDAIGLCYFNFQTKNPPEINYYLRNKVGCVNTTHDRKNYVFRGAKPGQIYLPRAQAAQPPVVKAKLKLNSWIGLGAKLGSTVVIMGIEQMGGWVVSISDLVNMEPHIRTIVLNAQTTRMGLGVGASGGACLIYITSLRDPSQLNKLMTGGMDFSLAIGGNAGELIKAGSVGAKLKKLEPLVKAILKIGGKTPDILKKQLMHPDKMGDLYKAIKSLRETLQSEDDKPEPEVLVADLPVSGGTEVAIFHGVSEFRVLGQPVFDANWE